MTSWRVERWHDDLHRGSHLYCILTALYFVVVSQGPPSQYRQGRKWNTVEVASPISVTLY